MPKMLYLSPPPLNHQSDIRPILWSTEMPLPLPYDNFLLNSPSSCPLLLQSIMQSLYLLLRNHASLLLGNVGPPPPPSPWESYYPPPPPFLANHALPFIGH